MILNWKVEYSDKANEELNEFDKAQRTQIKKVIARVSQNPLPQSEGGYGKSLHAPLAGLCKIKLKKLGIRVVYKLIKREEDDIMEIIVISVREDGEVYKIAETRNKS